MSQLPSTTDAQTAPNEESGPRPLDESLYLLEEGDVAFLEQQTGIKDPDEMKRHLVAVQERAYKIRPYHCIRAFGFAKLKISRFPVYKDLLRLGRERPGALLLDLGCCMGTDLRKAVADGFPVAQVLGVDMHADFWDLGHTLAKSTPETFPAAFLGADIFSPTTLTPPASLPTTAPTTPHPPLASLTSLTPLVGRLTAIHTSAFFHLFSEEQQLALARRIAPLLSPAPGSVIFGAHSGMPSKGTRTRKNTHGIYMFCHSPESWREMWEREVFGAGEVSVEAVLMEWMRKDGDAGPRMEHVLVWCVKRV